LTDSRATGPFGAAAGYIPGNSCGSTCCLYAASGWVQSGMWCSTNTPGACGVYPISQTAGNPCLWNLSTYCWNGFATMMPQFWIGPSDLVKFQGHCNYACGFVGSGKGGYTTSCSCINITYSFTTVSE
jgi:hypothetical protein